MSVVTTGRHSVTASSSGADSWARAFANPFEDLPGPNEKLLGPDNKINEAFQKKVSDKISELLIKLHAGLAEELDDEDQSIYTGGPGIAFLHLLMYRVLDNSQNDRHLHLALKYIEPHLDGLKKVRICFLNGDGGMLALGAVIYHKLGNTSKSQRCIDRLISRGKSICDDPNTPDELLTGRVGYLYSLVFVRNHIGEDSIDAELVDSIYKKILSNGQSVSRRRSSVSPLLYTWHFKFYLGAAHGVSGIIFMLMQVYEPRYKEYLFTLLKPTLNYLITLKYTSGNYPSSLESAAGDRLVHWCHGAPGWIYMFIKAYQIFQEEKYLDEAKCCADVIWSRGLLKKGYGICHGVAGNAYGLLALYNATQDEKYLYRAMKFAEWCLDYGNHGCRTADRPFSLFEGLAGTIYFLIDIIDPTKARFPGYEL